MQIYTIFRKIASTHPQFLHHPKREVRNQTLEVRTLLEVKKDFLLGVKKLKKLRRHHRLLKRWCPYQSRRTCRTSLTCLTKTR